jgi:hypothetical protein
MLIKKRNITTQELLTFLLLFLVMSLKYLGFYLTPNQEEYFLLAKLFIHPEFLPNTFTAYDVPGTRILFQYIAGFFLQYMSFESFAFWSGCVNFLLYSFILTKIFKKLNFSVIEALIVIAVFFLPKQNFFGGEWMIRGFEGKTLAYVFVLWSLYEFLGKKYLTGVILAAFSVYFHVLVGGWYSIIIFGYLLLKEGFFRCFKFGIIYIFLVSPVMIYLFTNYFVDNPSIINGMNTNWIYTALRNSRHTYPFKSLDFFVTKFLGGTILTLISYMLCIFYFRRCKDENLAFFNTLNIIIFTQQFLFLLIAAFDKNGFILKYYPFRLSCLAVLFMYIILVLYTKKYLLLLFPENLTGKIKDKSKIIWSLTIILIMSFVGVSLKDNLRHIKSYNDSIKQKSELYKFVRNNTLKNDVFIFYKHENRFKYADLSFMRNTQREVFSIKKFIPTSSRAIYAWYIRLQENNKLDKNISYLREIENKYKIDYLLSASSREDKSLKLIYKDKRYYLYKIKKV